MTIKQLFDKIFQHPDLITQPPVLLDIGASGSLPDIWKDIARYAICIAFDADDREMDFINDKAKNFRQLHVINKIVTDQDTGTADFYLTASPFCSSLLQPDNESLADWAFVDLFKVDRKIQLPAISLQNALAGLSIDYIDWFKSDAQGLDLSLFKNIGNKQYTAIIADFEPGFIDAYKGEDKIKDLLKHMDNMPFWLHSFNPGKTQRMNSAYLKTALSDAEVKNIQNTTVTSAIYAEITYINNFKQQLLHTERYYLLGCAFALVLKQYGFAAELALKGRQLNNHTIFDMVLQYIKKTTAKTNFTTLLTQPNALKTKVINTLVRNLQKLL